MIRSLTLLSTLAIPLALGACGKKDEAADAPAAAQQAETAQADAAPAEAPPASFWPAIAPLVAGTYKGECLQLPEMKNQGGAITVAANGKASAAGIDSDLSKSTTIVLSRHNQEGGGHSTIATLETDGGDSKVHFQLQAEAKSADSKATLLLGERQLSCSNVGTMDQLNAKPLHASLAKLLDAGSRKMKCVSTANLLSQPERTVQVAGGVVTVGDEKFQLDKAEFETATLTDGSNGFTYMFKISEAQQLNLMYNGAGKLVSAMGVTIEDKKHICSVEG